MISFQYGICLPVIWFFIGIIGLIIRRNLLFILISIEIMITAAAIAFIIAGSTWYHTDSAIMYLLIISFAATETSIILALILQFYRNYHNLNIDSLNEIHDK
ncbi:MAG: NADH-quinone oxidoreductase subunit NuoK [Candidatus Dasytiphilus stammeri]